MNSTGVFHQDGQDRDQSDSNELTKFSWKTAVKMVRELGTIM